MFSSLRYTIGLPPVFGKHQEVVRIPFPSDEDGDEEFSCTLSPSTAFGLDIHPHDKLISVITLDEWFDDASGMQNLQSADLVLSCSDSGNPTGAPENGTTQIAISTVHTDIRRTFHWNLEEIEEEGCIAGFPCRTVVSLASRVNSLLLSLYITEYEQILKDPVIMYPEAGLNRSDDYRFVALGGHFDIPTDLISLNSKSKTVEVVWTPPAWLTSAKYNLLISSTEAHAVSAPNPSLLEVYRLFAYGAGTFGRCVLNDPAVNEGNCGAGFQERELYCWKRLPGGSVQQVPLRFCRNETRIPATKRSCLMPCAEFYFDVSLWSECDRTCGGGKQVRTVECRWGMDFVDLSLCGEDWPPTERNCNPQGCLPSTIITGTSQCAPLFGENGWVAPKFCHDILGFRTHPQRCNSTPAAEFGIDLPIELDSTVHSTEVFEEEKCRNSTEHLVYKAGPWSACSAPCTDPLQGSMPIRTRNIQCIDTRDGSEQDEELCAALLSTPPPHSEACNTGLCEQYVWEVGEWSFCDAFCGRGSRSRTVQCVQVASNTIVHSDFCLNSSSLATPGIVEKGFVPPSVEECHIASCSCSSAKDCHTEGILNSYCSARKCKCLPGFEGPSCTLESPIPLDNCDGARDRAGHCCEGAIAGDGFCCGNGTLLDRDGQCCHSESLDACGVCGGNGVVVDVYGRCCSTGLAPSGECCSSQDDCGYVLVLPL